MNYFFIFGAKYLFFLSVIIAAIYFFKSLDKRKLFKFGVIILPVSYIFGLVARTLYYNPRPFVTENFTPLIDHVADNGFPSDHTLFVASLAVWTTLFNKKLGLVLWCIALVVAISRVYVGVHHPVDVLGSIVISALVGLMLYCINKYGEQPNK
ncbi:MAG TPA: phosphatase PAP2 family protein [Parcubacteria group bacterium]|nr:phosphatase PAP2 family protein [Parcubacteria group bacterium]